MAVVVVRDVLGAVDELAPRGERLVIGAAGLGTTRGATYVTRSTVGVVAASNHPGGSADPATSASANSAPVMTTASVRLGAVVA